MNIEYTGTLPDVTQEIDFSPEMAEAGKIAFLSVMENFDRGGRPAWPGLKSGGNSHLTKSGALRGSIEVQTDKSSFWVWTSVQKIVYALIHQTGGVIQHPGSKKFQAWPGKDGRYVYALGTKPHPIPIPERRYMMFQKEDRERIQKLFKDRIVNFFETKRRPVGTQS